MTLEMVHRPTVAVFADAQNVNLFKHSTAILDFVNSLGDVPCLYAYHHWRSVPLKKEQKLQSQSWRCVDIPTIAKNEVDKNLMKDFVELCRFREPDILVLITNDGDFEKMVRPYLKPGRQVIVIGYKSNMSQKLRRLLPKGILFVENLRNALPGLT
ncbi:NYN domain-containing protein [Leptolyngbya sp. KIOST-1]|uniref:NYN domain-containing protein n=1 Tax=Leptolyngbya sp. KIOST-1 TaxID=1229172 RepID=UPI00055D3F7E|nr:NYN domain-containing protein [Leptolyngbya sp. KIOST-1]